MSEIIRRHGFAVISKSRTAENFATAINKLSSDKKLKAKIKNNINKQKGNFTWNKTMQPLVEYISSLPPYKKSSAKTKSPSTQKPTKLSIYRRSRKAAKILIKGQ